MRLLVSVDADGSVIAINLAYIVSIRTPSRGEKNKLIVKTETETHMLNMTFPQFLNQVSVIKDI